MKQKKRIITADVVAPDEDMKAMWGLRLGDKLCFDSMVIRGGFVHVAGVTIIKGDGKGAKLFSEPLPVPPEEPRGDAAPEEQWCGEEALDPDGEVPDDASDWQIRGWIDAQYEIIKWAEAQMAAEARAVGSDLPPLSS